MNTPDKELKDFGRTMPYKVPEGFFDSLSRQIIAAAESEPIPRPTVLRPRRRWAATARKLILAASVAVVATLAFVAILRSPSVTLDDVEEAYSSMSAEDQDLISFDYDDDIFLALTD